MFWPLLKTSLQIACGYILRSYEVRWSFVCMVIILNVAIYMHILAFWFGLIVMEPMDAGTFLSTHKANINYMSVTGFDGHTVTKEKSRNTYHELLKRDKKFCYKVVSLFGDLYYEEMSVEEALNKAYFYYEGDQALKN